MPKPWPGYNGRLIDLLVLVQDRIGLLFTVSISPLSVIVRCIQKNYCESYAMFSQEQVSLCSVKLSQVSMHMAAV